jgi:LysR family transcriptional regulator, regulator for metE and metH
MTLEVRHLDLVRAIAEEGSVTRAGLRLHLTQSALSHQLRDAEERLGLRLFDRVGRRLQLSAAGERVLASARSVLAELSRVETELRGDAAKPREQIRLTTQCNTVYHWLPSRLRRFQRTHPDVELEVVAGATDDPIPALTGGEIDLAIVHRYTRDPRLRFVPLFRDEVVVVMRPAHRLARARFVAAADFASERLILYSIPRESNLVFSEVLIPAGVSPKRVTHIQLTEAIVEMVKAGVGISVLPRWSVAPQLERGELIARPLTRDGKYRAWSAAYRSRGAPEHLLAFVDLLEKYPIPLGTTARERRRIAATLVDVGAEPKARRNSSRSRWSQRRRERYHSTRQG